MTREHDGWAVEALDGVGRLYIRHMLNSIELSFNLSALDTCVTLTRQLQQSCGAKKKER